ncbi:cupin domain-containing protein [Halorussus sp. AFM4]|uniref:cupin domain-containing protein n=1 Tax=Halorussus sp. AFM4 TaxID=3421651 RepID=UPI003EBC1AAB
MTDSSDPTEPSDWPWPESLDAAEAAPESHEVLLENDRVRVVEVAIPPGEREPVHTHRWPGVVLVDRAARIRYYDGEGEVAYESPERGDGEVAEASPPETEWMAPEGPHGVENVDTVPYHAIRVELKSR